jgi:uncharacterized protein
MIGILNNREINAVLSRNLVGRIGCHSNNRTYIVPISFAFDDEFIYAHSSEGMKLDYMRNNPEVCFQVDSFENMANWHSVVAWGVFEELKEENDRRTALKHLLARVLPVESSETTHLSPHWPFPPGDSTEIEGVFFRIRITEKSGRFEGSEPQKYFAS